MFEQRLCNLPLNANYLMTLVSRHALSGSKSTVTGQPAASRLYELKGCLLLKETAVPPVRQDGRSSRTSAETGPPQRPPVRENIPLPGSVRNGPRGNP